MNTSINDILIEWAYRVKDGKPNPKSIRDRIVLESVLKDFGWNVVQRNALIENLTEAPDNKPLSKQDKDKIKKMGLIWKGKGYGKENEEGIIFKNVDGLIENTYTLKVLNKTIQAQTYNITFSGLKDATMIGPKQVTISSGEIFTQPISIAVDPYDIKEKKRTITIKLINSDDSDEVIQQDASFFLGL